VTVGRAFKLLTSLGRPTAESEFSEIEDSRPIEKPWKAESDEERPKQSNQRQREADW
jgi:hypothetical protein